MKLLLNHSGNPLSCTHCKDPLTTVYLSDAFEREEETLHYIICGCGNVMEAVLEDTEEGKVISKVFKTPENYTKETAERIRHAFDLFEGDSYVPSFEFFSIKGNVLLNKEDTEKNLLLSTLKNKLKGNTLSKKKKEMEKKGLSMNPMPLDDELDLEEDDCDDCCCCDCCHDNEEDEIE